MRRTKSGPRPIGRSAVRVIVRFRFVIYTGWGKQHRNKWGVPAGGRVCFCSRPIGTRRNSSCGSWEFLLRFGQLYEVWIGIEVAIVQTNAKGPIF